MDNSYITGVKIKAIGNKIKVDDQKVKVNYDKEIVKALELKSTYKSHILEYEQEKAREITG